MPNIHVYGFKGGWECCQTRKLICEAVQELGLAHDAVITLIPSVVKNCDDSERPAQYIHVFSTRSEEIERIVEVLRRKNFGLDTETPTAFYDAKAMENETGPAERARLIERLLNKNPIPIDIPREVREAHLNKQPLAILRELEWE